MQVDRVRSAVLSPMGEDGARVLVRLGEVRVAVCSRVALVRETVAEFYPVVATGEPAWTVTAVEGSAPTGAARTRFGVGVRVEVQDRRVRLWSPTACDLAVTTRKVVREVFLTACERAGYTMLHASAIYTDEQVVVFAADKRGGKTTLALRAVLEHGWRWLSNDHLIVLPEGPDALVATSLPTPIPVKAGTLVDLWDRLPQPWDVNGFDVDAWRRLPADRRYAADDAAYFTFARFGQPNPVLVPLSPRQVSVVFPRYADRRETVAAPAPVDMLTTATQLAAHVRLDWISTDGSRQRHLPWGHRAAEVFSADGARLARRLAQLASGGWQWAHHGDPGPLLDTMTGSLR